MQRIWVAIISAGLLCLGLPLASASTPKVGAICVKLNQQQIIGNYKFTCSKTGKVSKWTRTVIASNPKSTPTNKQVAAPFADDSAQITNVVIAGANVGAQCILPSWQNMDQPSTLITTWYLSPIYVLDDPGTSVFVGTGTNIYFSIPLTPGQSISEYLVCYSQAINAGGKASSLDSVPITVSLPGVSPSPGPIVTPPAPTPTPTTAPTSCDGPQATGAVPSWSTLNPQNLNSDWVKNNLQVSWCPAFASSGGPIIYTATIDPGGYTCTATTTTCTIVVPSSFSTGKYSVMATNQNGSSSNSPVYSTDGSFFDCSKDPTNCVNLSKGYIFPDYGNVWPTALGDCTFAAVADWQQLVFNQTYNSTKLGFEFSDAGGSETSGLSIQRLFYYWTTHGIDGHFLSTPYRYPTDEITLKSELDGRYPLIGVLQFTGTDFIGNVSTPQGGHALLVSGYTPEGPIVVTWGTTIQMTWQQWNSEATDIYALAVK